MTWHNTQTTSWLLNYTMAQNDKGVHLPLWGTCMGLQVTPFHSTPPTSPPVGCHPFLEPADCPPPLSPKAQHFPT